MDSSFTRDAYSRALINTDVTGIHVRRQEKRQTQKIIELQQEILVIKQDLLEIKQLLQNIISGE
jgi:hypothetical protein